MGKNYSSEEIEIMLEKEAECISQVEATEEKLKTDIAFLTNYLKELEHKTSSRFSKIKNALIISDIIFVASIIVLYIIK